MTYKPPVYLRGTNNGPPENGYFRTGDACRDLLGREWHCTTGGTNTAAVWKVVTRILVVTNDEELANPMPGDLILNKS